MNESALILSAFENRVTAALTMQTNLAVEQHKNINARFYELGINLGIVNPRLVVYPEFIPKSAPGYPEMSNSWDTSRCECS